MDAAPVRRVGLLAPSADYAATFLGGALRAGVWPADHAPEQEDDEDDEDAASDETGEDRDDESGVESGTDDDDTDGLYHNAHDIPSAADGSCTAEGSESEDEGKASGGAASLPTAAPIAADIATVRASERDAFAATSRTLWWVRVRFPSGGTAHTVVTPGTTVRTLKRALVAAAAAAVARLPFDLQYGSRLMEDDRRTLASYGVWRECTVYVIARRTSSSLAATELPGSSRGAADAAAPLIIKMYGGKTLQLTTFTLGATVAQIKKAVEASESIPPDQQVLTFKTSVLEDARTLAQCDVRPGSTLRLIHGAPPRTNVGTVIVRTLTGKTLTVRISLDAAVFDLHEAIERQMGAPVENQRLIFEDQVLEHERALGDYGIVRGSTVSLTLRLRGAERQRSGGRGEAPVGRPSLQEWKRRSLAYVARCTGRSSIITLAESVAPSTRS
jgi:hypothetical protein